MNDLTAKTDRERLLSNLIIQWHRKAMIKKELEQKILSTKKFPMGTYVCGFKSAISQTSGTFVSIPGKIVGWNDEFNCYKICYELDIQNLGYCDWDRNSDCFGLLSINGDDDKPKYDIANFSEDNLEIYHGDWLPLSIVKYNPMTIDRINFSIKEEFTMEAHEQSIIGGKKMSQIKPVNENKFWEIANKAIEEYKYRIDSINKQKEFLETKKFHFGDIIMKKNTRNSIETAFDVGKGSIGKIIGWDFEENYYRVFYSEQMPFIGVREDEMEKYCGIISDELLTHDVYEIDSLLIRL